MRQEDIVLRSRILFAVRTFFTSCGFIEVETPNRLPLLIPEAHIDPLTSEGWYLHTSPEMCMKRLLAKGFEKIFQICRCYRRGERGRRHLPEFTLLEWYEVNRGYEDLMQRCESLILSIAQNLFNSNCITYGRKKIDLTPPWERISVSEAFLKYAGVSVESAMEDDRYDEIMGLTIEPFLGEKKPLFLYDYPIEQGALARRKKKNPAVAERFELYISGVELSNAFSELTDAGEQRHRFEKALETRALNNLLPIPMPERFLSELPLLPPCAGNALGIDRLVMIFADTSKIEDVTTFTPEELE